MAYFLELFEGSRITACDNQSIYVDRCMELDDNKPEKSGLKGLMTIAMFEKGGRYSTLYLSGGMYAEIIEASFCRNQIMKQHMYLYNQI